MRFKCILLLSLATCGWTTSRVAADCGPPGLVQIHGRVMTCPYTEAPEPLVGCPVQISFENPDCSGFTVWTDNQGFWSATLTVCDQFVTASLGNPVTKGACKRGCCKTVVEYVDCSANNVAFSDLSLPCGGPKEPPCPSQGP